MTKLDDSSNGIEAARQAIVGIAEGDQGAALRGLNECSHAEAVNAASYLLKCLVSSVYIQVGHDPERLRAALLAGAEGAEEDKIVTAVENIVNDAFREG